ncbi:TonB-dependent siderophore receptor [Steroidobacter sp.]|uniref:TonB-dependent siderophore receptor n=1 Tax=Steroidobacter sp. TaxID=1978227 RepID=UPI001A46A4A0|nr:TonB-dependent receptor [Steroidobacter sp.]MBL8266020.1 TonB-dependent siderophore receptor [Steroidobacter sp.]
MPASSLANSVSELLASRRPNTAVLPRVLLCLSVATFAPYLPAAAQSDNKQSWTIPAGPLGRALSVFAVDSGVPLSFDPLLVKGRTTNGLTGEYTVQEGFKRLLEGTALVAVQQTTGGYVLRALSTSPRSERRSDTPSGVQRSDVDGSADSVERITVLGQLIAPMEMGRGVASLREIPQSITVMSSQQIEEQNITDLREALARIAGVTVQTSSLGRPVFYSRGFQINSVQLDGSFPVDATALGYNNDFDMAQYQQVELLRGADGLFSGTGDPGGVVNLVRKRPQQAAQVAFAASAGSWSNRRAELDVSFEPSYDGRWRNRFVALTQDRDYFYDVATMKKNLLYGISEFDVSEQLMVTVGGSYEERNSTPWWSGLPRYSDGRDLQLPRSTFLGTAWSRWNFNTDELFGRLDYKLSEGWSVRANVNRSNQTSGVRHASSNGAVNPVTGAGPTLGSSHAAYVNVQEIADVSMTGKFQAFGLDHSVVFGADWQHITRPNYRHWFGPYANIVQPVDPFNFDPNAYLEPAQNGYWFTWPSFYSKQHGAFAVARVALTQSLRLIAGLRYGQYEYQQRYYTYNTAGAIVGETRTKFDDAKTTPYGGITFELNDDWLVYASYSSTYRPQGTLLAGPLPGAPLDPIEGTNYELGVKGSLFAGRVTTSVALYDIKRNNQGIRDTSLPIVGACCWLQEGDVTSRGIDTEIQGELLPGWNVSAGYTYNDNESKVSGAAFSSVTPKHLFRLWSTTQLPGRLSRLRVGGGVNAQSSSFVSGTVTTWNETTTPWTQLGNVPFRFTQDAYAVWDARVEYDINDNWGAALNFNNLSDEVYYQTVGTSASGNWYGEPRNFTVSLRGKF